MNLYRLAPDIYVIEDFITLEEQSYIYNYMSSSDESSWWYDKDDAYHTKGGFFDGKHITFKYDDIYRPDIFNDIDLRLKDLFEDFVNLYPITINRHLEDQFMTEHRDHDPISHTECSRYGIVIYYNDSYIGGEIEYPEFGILHKPKAGSLVIHGGNVLHGTKPVMNKVPRYFSTTFVTGTIDRPVKLNKDIFANIEESFYC